MTFTEEETQKIADRLIHWVKDVCLNNSDSETIKDFITEAVECVIEGEIKKAKEDHEAREDRILATDITDEIFYLDFDESELKGYKLSLASYTVNIKPPKSDSFIVWGPGSDLDEEEVKRLRKKTLRRITDQVRQERESEKDKDD